MVVHRGKPKCVCVNKIAGTGGQSQTLLLLEGKKQRRRENKHCSNPGRFVSCGLMYCSVPLSPSPVTLSTLLPENSLSHRALQPLYQVAAPVHSFVKLCTWSGSGDVTSTTWAITSFCPSACLHSCVVLCSHCAKSLLLLMCGWRKLPVSPVVSWWRCEEALQTLSLH